MKLENRVRKIEERLDHDDGILPCLMGRSAEDLERKIAKFEAANPGKPYDTILIEFIRPTRKVDAQDLMA